MPELRRRDREHAGAAADVEHAARFLREQELEAEARRRVRAGAEGAAGVHDDGQRVCRRLLPRRADPERPDPGAAVKRSPPILPPRLELGRARRGEGRKHAEPRVGVGGELDLVPTLFLLEALRRQFDEARPQLLDLGTRDADRGADQRKALLSLRMKPSSVSS